MSCTHPCCPVCDPYPSAPVWAYWPVLWIAPVPPPPFVRPPEQPASPPAPPAGSELPREIAVDADTPNVESWVGGDAPVRLRIEYRALAADKGAAAGVALELDHEDGLSAVWKHTVSGPAPESATPFAQVAPGTRLRLRAEAAAARLFWKETVY